jgi:hypothetical protein
MKSNQKGNHLYAYKDTIRRLFLLTLFSFLIVESYAQNKTISGQLQILPENRLLVPVCWLMVLLMVQLLI